MEEALAGLLKKYKVQENRELNLSPSGRSNGLSLLPGWMWVNTSPEENQVPLLTWRLKRKFLELKKIVEDATIENVRMLRFSCMGAEMNGIGIRYYTGNWIYVSLSGVGKLSPCRQLSIWEQSGNAILKLDNNIICSVEISTRMPAGSDLADRHEMIARRGVASDLVVDTMVPQNSIYSYTDDGENRYRDVDMELYGFNEEKIDHVRSAFQVLKQPGLMQQWKLQHQRLVNFTQFAFISDKERKKITFNN